MGLSLIVVGMGLLAYYTVWILVLPFVEPKQWIHKLFPDRYWALAGPLLAMVIGLTILIAFIGLVLIKAESKKKKASAGVASNKKKN